MGCTQSKPSNNLRKKQKKERRSSKEYKVDEPNHEAEVPELGEMQIPEEHQAIRNQTTVSDKNPVTQWQYETSKTGIENDMEVKEPKHVGRPHSQQVPEDESALAHFEAHIDSEVDIAQRVSSNIKGNSVHYVYKELNADKYNSEPPPASSSTNNGRNIPAGKNSSVYKGPSFPLGQAGVPKNYVDETNKKDDPRVQKRRGKVDLSRQLDSNESAAGDIGSICVDARTGEYKYYQGGVFIGHVNKEEALKLSNDWPLCPGNTVSRVQPEGHRFQPEGHRFQPEEHINFREQASSKMNDFPFTSSRSRLNNAQVRRGPSTKVMGGLGRSNTSFCDQPRNEDVPSKLKSGTAREQVSQSIPEYARYYM